MVLCDLLDCTPNDLIQPVEVPAMGKLPKRQTAVGDRGVGDLVPKPARIRPTGGRSDRQ